MKVSGFVIFVAMIFIVACTQKNKQKIKYTNNKDSTNEYVGANYLHHKKKSEYNFTTEKEWDSLNGISNHSESLPKYTIRKDYKTYGWHLYSKGSAYKKYNFSMLWGISYFSYIVNPETGNYKTIHQWKTTALVDSAKVNNCKVFLSVSNFGSHNNTIFLDNPKAQETLIDSLGSLLRYRQADGVNIDFEEVRYTSKKKFTNFIIKLSKKLKNKDPNVMVSLALYAVDYHSIFDIKSINPYVDFYTLMAYDYYGGFSKNAGPVSPLRSSNVWGENSIESSVNYYLNEGVDPQKMIVCLPYYGAKWQVDRMSVPSKTKKFISHPEYSETKTLLESKKYTINFDTLSATRYITFKENEVIKQLWYDDSLSLSYKYDWIISKKLSGVGIWALGYDHGDNELWELLANKFGKEE